MKHVGPMGLPTFVFRHDRNIYAIRIYFSLTDLYYFLPLRELCLCIIIQKYIYINKTSRPLLYSVLSIGVAADTDSQRKVPGLTEVHETEKINKHRNEIVFYIELALTDLFFFTVSSA